MTNTQRYLNSIKGFRKDLQEVNGVKTKLDDANRELVKDSSGYHTPLFEVSYEADSVFRNGYENCPNLN